MIKLMRIVIPILWAGILIIPPLVFIQNRSVEALSTASTAFPIFGLIAFTLVWSQLMIGSFMRLLTRIYPRILAWHIAQGLTALGFALLHPFLLILSLRHDLGIYFGYQFVPSGFAPYVYLGQAALLLLVIAVAAALLRRWPPIQRYWHWIHLLNYGVFFLVWFHSWNLGGDIQTTPLLRGLWQFFFVTVIAGLVYRRLYIPSQIGLIKATS